MTDPASLAFEVVGTVAVAVHTTRKAQQFIDSIHGAPRAISALSADLAALGNVLDILNDMLKRGEAFSNRIQNQMIALLEVPLRNCTETLNEVSNLLEPFAKASSSAKITKWRGFLWTFKVKEL